MHRKTEAVIKLYRKPFFLLLGFLMSLVLLSACSGGQQATEYPSGDSESSPPEQSVEVTHPEEDSVQTESSDPEMNDDDVGEKAVSEAPQTPGISAGQPEESVHPANGTITSDSEPAAPPVQETPSEAPELQEPLSGDTAGESVGSEEEITEMKMNVQVGASTFTATLEDNAAVDALVEMMKNGPVTIQMSDYAGFEKVGDLGASLPTSHSQTTTQEGDIVLYQGNQIVLFYGSNSWSYTRLGRIDNLTGWAEALGDGNVSVTFSLEG